MAIALVLLVLLLVGGASLLWGTDSRVDDGERSRRLA
jgi:hypothetical protein